MALEDPRPEGVDEKQAEREEQERQASETREEQQDVLAHGDEQGQAAQQDPHDHLIPIAPLDGSAVVGSFVPAYGAFLRNPANAKYTWAAFGLVFLLAGELFGVGADLASSYVRWVVGA